METCITNGILVSVNTEYQEYYSNPQENQYSFSYHISIQNNSDSTFKLISRHWYIFDSVGTKYEVEGVGVVGKQPIIEPGMTHEYVSGCNFLSTIGQMHGYYIMERILDQKQFKIQIPKFLMIHPSLDN
ncbi:MAG: Co2+/Mg2+ efflux protein ApaG [Leadbetterella sp.]